MKKILFISNIANKIDSFSIPSISAAMILDCELHIAANWGHSSAESLKKYEKEHHITIHHIDFIRHPLHPGNIKAYKQLVRLISREKFDLIHCNTPIGGLAGRMAAKKCGVKKVIYQAHGFHFYQGAPIFNWLFYYPAEKWLARYTDVLITINREDDKRAQKLKLRNQGRSYFVPGVGIDLTAYGAMSVMRKEKCAELGIGINSLIVLTTGDLIKRKNNQIIIKALSRIKDTPICYVICGVGPLEEKLKALCRRYHIESSVKFLGYRSDVKELLAMSDVFTLSSYQEGLSRSVMEAMAAGKPCVISDIRGNRDLIQDTKGGYLITPDDIGGFAKAFVKLAEDSNLRLAMGRYNLETIRPYGTGNITTNMVEIYRETLDSD